MIYVTRISALLLAVVIVVGCAAQLQDARETVQVELNDLRERYAHAREGYIEIRTKTVSIMEQVDERLTEIEQRCEDGLADDILCGNIDDARNLYEDATQTVIDLDRELRDLDAQLADADGSAQDLLDQIEAIENAQRRALGALERIISIIL